MRQLQPLLGKNLAGYSTIICLSGVRVPLIALKVLRLFGATILVNQNGVYYPSWYPENYEKKNLYLKKLNRIANHTFFQSAFAQKSYLDWLGELPPQSSILYNPVDIDFYKPVIAKQNTIRMNRVLIFADIQPRLEGLWNHLLDFVRYMDMNQPNVLRKSELSLLRPRTP